MKRLIMTAAGALTALAAITTSVAGPAGAATVSTTAATADTSGPAPGHVLTHERFAGQLRQVPATRIPRPHLPGHLVKHGSTATANNWSGYAVQASGSNHLRYVESDFTIPSINPASAAGTSDVYWASHWAGLDGFANNKTVEQAGIDATVENGAVVYYAWYEMYPLSPVVFQLAAQPGDNIDVAVYYDQGAKLWYLTLNDTTQGVSLTTSQAAPAGTSPANTSAEVISEDPGGAVPAGYYLADFGQANYSNARVTSYSTLRGGLGSSSQWTSYAVTMQNGSHVMATAGPLYNGTSGGIPVSAFSDYWHASS